MTRFMQDEKCMTDSYSVTAFAASDYPFLQARSLSA